MNGKSENKSKRHQTVFAMKNITFKYGFRMFAGFTALFLLMHFLNISDNYNLRALNGIIHLGFIYLLLREYRKAHPETVDNYLSGVATGMEASMIAVVPFALGMFLFLTFNTEFYEHLRAQSPLPEYFRPFMASLFIFTEGIVVSLIGSYILTRVVDAQWEVKVDKR